MTEESNERNAQAEIEEIRKAGVERIQSDPRLRREQLEAIRRMQARGEPVRNDNLNA